jgi:hypothetical protein
LLKYDIEFFINGFQTSDFTISESIHNRIDMNIELLQKNIYFCQMSNLLKTTAIFFSSLLFSVSIITENFCFVVNPKTITSGQESLSSDLPFENLSQFLSNRNGEKLISTIKNIPVFNLRNQTFDIHNNRISCEPAKLRICPEYSQSSEIISSNLTTSNIIFPFHYFW